MKHMLRRTRFAGFGLLLGVLFFLAAGCGKDGDVSQVLDVRAPKAVENLQAFPADRKVRVTWQANPEPDILGYNIYRAVAADGGFTQIGSTGRQQAPFFQDEGEDVNGDGIPDGLTNQIRYFYKVTVYDREGRETALNLSAAVSAVPGVQPGALDDLYVTNVRTYGGDSRAIVTWTITQSTSVFGYFVFRQVLGAPEGLRLAALVPQGKNFFQDGELPNGSEVSYGIAPVTRNLFQGRLVEGKVVRIDPGDQTRPKPPGSSLVNGPFSLVSVGAAGVTLQWGRPTQNTDGSLLFQPGGLEDELVGGGFIIFRSQTAEGAYEPVGILEAIGNEGSYTYTDPQGTSEHFYEVKAFDRFGTLSGPSRRLSTGSTILPDVIRGVDAFASTSFRTISVNWDLDPTSMSGYRVFRSTRRDMGYKQISGNLPPTQNFFQDGLSVLDTGQTFYYRVAGLAQVPGGEILQGALSDPAPAISGPSDGVFYLEAEDATVLAATPGAFATVARQGFPRPFSGRGALFVDMAAAAIPDGFTTFMDLQWSVEIDSSGPAGAPGTYDVLLRVIRNQNSGIFDVRVQDVVTGAVAQRNGLDFYTADFGFPPRVSTIFLGQITVLDADFVGGNPINETLNMRLSYQGFNPAVAQGNGEVFLDGLVLVRR
jgi:hypothetical protein